MPSESREPIVETQGPPPVDGPRPRADAVPTVASDAPVPPPPAPLLSPRAQQRTVLGLLGTSTVGFALAQLDALAALPIQPFAAFLLGYALVVAIGWMPDGTLKTRIARSIHDSLFQHAGVTFYGFVAFGFFTSLTLESIVDHLVRFDLNDEIQSLLMQRVTRFSLDSLMNFVRAVAWPWPLMEDYAKPAAGAFVVVSWLAFQALSRLLPHRLVVEKKPKKDKKAKKRAKKAGETFEADALD